MLDDASVAVFSGRNMGPSLDFSSLIHSLRSDTKVLFLDQCHIETLAEEEDLRKRDVEELFLDANEFKRFSFRNPWLKNVSYLSLANNMIETCDGLECMMNLKVLKLSGNRLTTLPKFSGTKLCSTLEVLSVGKNMLAHLSDFLEIQFLTSLEKFDGRWNPVGDAPQVSSFILLLRPSLTFLNGDVVDDEYRREASKHSKILYMNGILQAMVEMEEVFLQSQVQVHDPLSRMEFIAYLGSLTAKDSKYYDADVIKDGVSVRNKEEFCDVIEEYGVDDHQSRFVSMDARDEVGSLDESKEDDHKDDQEDEVSDASRNASLSLTDDNDDDDDGGGGGGGGEEHVTMNGKEHSMDDEEDTSMEIIVLDESDEEDNPEPKSDDLVQSPATIVENPVGPQWESPDLRFLKAVEKKGGIGGKGFDRDVRQMYLRLLKEPHPSSLRRKKRVVAKENERK